MICDNLTITERFYYMFLKAQIWPSFKEFQYGGCSGVTDSPTDDWQLTVQSLHCLLEHNSDNLKTPRVGVTGARILKEKAETLGEL